MTARIIDTILIQVLHTYSYEPYFQHSQNPSLRKVGETGLYFFYKLCWASLSLLYAYLFDPIKECLHLASFALYF